MPTWLLLSLASAFVFALSQVFSKKGLQHISPLWNNIFFSTAALIIWVPFSLFSKTPITFPSPVLLGILFLAGACYMLFYYAIEKGDISLTGSLSAVYPVSTVILSYIFLHERIVLFQQIGIIIALIGVVVISIPPQNLAYAISKHKTWVVWGIVSALINGTGDFFVKIAINTMGEYSQMLFLAVCLLGVSAMNYAVDKKGRKLPKLSVTKLLPSFLGVISSAVGFVLFFTALHVGKASLVAPATSIYPGIIVLLAFLFLQERITLRQLVGIFIIMGGVMLLGFGA